MENALSTEKKVLVPSFDLTKELPNLSEARELPVDLSSAYWTPEKVGESKRAFFQRIENSTYVSEATGETVDLPCVILIAQDANGDVTTLRNGSKRLVAAIEEAVNDGRITEGMPLVITYLGEEKNKTNSFKSARWSVKPLIIG